MSSRLVVDGNAVYEIDDECMKKRQGRKGYGGRNRQGSVCDHPEAGVPHKQ